VARIVAVISLATGVVRDLAMGPYTGKQTGETALFRALFDGLKPGGIVVGDRCFGKPGVENPVSVRFPTAGRAERRVLELFAELDARTEEE
jgi:hypothetical protein